MAHNKMMTESAYVALDEHLRDVQSLFDDFCAQNGFVFVDRRSLGRYPRIRIEKLGTPNIWFDLWMELDQDGKRFEQFKRDLPYELAAGAFLDVQDGSKEGIRYQKTFQCFSGVPFDQLRSKLPSELKRTLKILETWNTSYLKEHGEKVKLGG